MDSPSDPSSPDSEPLTPAATPHRRRPRYSGKNPRQFHQKYKELAPEKNAATIEKVRAAGKTPAGMHVPVMVTEILSFLNPQPGQWALDATLGYGGHSQQLLAHILPGGHLTGLDADPLQLPRTENRLRALGFGPEVFSAIRSNFAGLPKVIASTRPVDIFLADLGCSSMQIDDPQRGFSFKGPLRSRCNSTGVRLVP